MPRQSRDYTGMTKDMLTALYFFGRDKGRNPLWVFKCMCGNTVVRRTNDVYSKKYTHANCGCTHVSATHKLTRSPTHTSWTLMKARCLNPKNPKYPDYGGRGITVCERWLQFESFLADMGQRPKNTTLDRIDVNKGYNPENCRWASTSQQANNKRTSVKISFGGMTLTVSEWSKKLDIPLKQRLYAGWDIHKALTIPKGGKHAKST